MSALKRRLRSLVIALAALALSAGVAMAARGTLPSSVPTGQTATQGDQNEQGDQAEATETEAPETEAPETEAPDTAAPDANTGDTGTAGVHPDNHGLLVSQAAQATTPTGFANHGAYVKTVAQANHGHSAAATTKTHGKH